MQISLDNKNLFLIFFLCLFFTMGLPSILPQMRLTFFAPFLIIACYQKSLQTCLWLALICGICLDLLASHTRLGLCSLTFCLTLIFLFPQRRNFFADSLSTLPIMTFLFSSLSTFILGLLLYSIESRNIFSWQWIQTDLVVMPLIDACYAFILFILPALFVKGPRKSGKDYFLSN